MADSPELSIEPAELATAPVDARASLSIGVTGHRLDRLDAAHVETIRATIATVFAAIATAAEAIADPMAIRLVTALADGADGFAADAALSQRWTIDAVLPFPRAQYAEDFDGPEARSHAEHLAAARSVFELPGERNATGEVVAYERAGRVVLSQSDIIVAVWDGEASRGRGGTAQIVAEAVLQDIPVIRIDPAAQTAPTILWDGLREHDLGQQTIDTVERGTLAHVPHMIATLAAPPVAGAQLAALERFGKLPRHGIGLAVAYPALLAIMGVRAPRWSDLRKPDAARAAALVMAACAAGATNDGSFGGRLRAQIAPRFARADCEATRVAQLFRSAYVASFALAALAVLLSLSGLLIPSSAKPVIVILEVATIGSILLLTRAGNRSGWHQRWLDNRELAERLRCLAIGAQIGELDLRVGADAGTPWVAWSARQAARAIGLPSLVADDRYLGGVRDSLHRMLDDQIAYLESDAKRMHRLEHRLHVFGTILFAMTALTCIAFLVIQTLSGMGSHDAYAFGKHFALGATVVGAAFPAVGAAIYGIRMQGDFAGVAERSEALSHRLATLRAVSREDGLNFDTLKRRVLRMTALLTEERATWRHAYNARPLALPG